MANVYNPSGKLCGSITMHRLRILYSAFKHSQLHQPETHKHYGHLDFLIAIARLLNRYTNKPTDGSKRSKLANQCTTPDRYMQALRNGLSVTTERFSSSLNFNPDMKCYFSMYAEDALFGANFDAYSVKWTGASQVNPEYEAVAMEKAMRWAILSAKEAAKPVLTAFVLPWWDDKGNSYARWLSHQTVQAIATIDRSKFKFNAPRHWADEQDQWCTPKRNVHQKVILPDMLADAKRHKTSLIQAPSLYDTSGSINTVALAWKEWCSGPAQRTIAQRVLEIKAHKHMSLGERNSNLHKKNRHLPQLTRLSI